MTLFSTRSIAVPDNTNKTDNQKAAASVVQTDADTGTEPGSAAEKSMRADRSDRDPRPGYEYDMHPYPNYDLLSLDQLGALAEKRGVKIRNDVWRAHMISELRAADTRTDL